MGTDRRWSPHNPCDGQEHVEHVLIYLSLWCFCRISRSERTGRYGSDMRKHDPECYGKRSRDVEKDYDRRWVHDRYKDYCDERRDQDSSEVSGEEFLCGLKYVLIRVILNLLSLKLNITLLYIFFSYRGAENDAAAADLMMNMMVNIQSRTTKWSRRRRAKRLCWGGSLSTSQKMM